MKNNKSAISITEAMVVLMIVTLWLVWVYGILTKSFRVTTNLWNKIQAIQIAREWIEAMQNIRDTNWLLFPLDKENCWITENYNSDCFGDETYNKGVIPPYIIQDDTSYKVYKNEDWRWYLEKASDQLTVWDYLNKDYRDFFTVNMLDNNQYTQSWWTSFSPTFTREIIITREKWNPKDPNESFFFNEDNLYRLSWINVKSIVKWIDSSSTYPSEVSLDMTLTNYKK